MFRKIFTIGDRDPRIMKHAIRNKNGNNNFSGGFTLFEIMVAVFIFSLIMASASTLFIASLRSQRKTLATQELLNQTSYVMEYMSRALRMARKDDVVIDGVTKNCLTLGNANFEINPLTNGVKFRNYKDECQEFYLESGQLRENKNGTVSDLTSSDLNAIDFNINLLGPLQTDQDQPRVTIFLKITGKESSLIQTQTTVSQRSLDVVRQ